MAQGGVTCLHLTPEMLEGAYEYLRTTPPFRRWKLPPGDDIVFQVHQKCTATDAVALHWFDKGHHHLAVSNTRVGHTLSLMEAMAHEMVHIQCHNLTKASHGSVFKRYAAQVCKYHGFDPKAF